MADMQCEIPPEKAIAKFARNSGRFTITIFDWERLISIPLARESAQRMTPPWHRIAAAMVTALLLGLNLGIGFCRKGLNFGLSAIIIQGSNFGQVDNLD
jgi:hypothetical protein